VIIRGGGSQAELNCFNSYWLCYHITQFPLPVITGIGHERDETIADMVAHTSLKTPTAVAEFIINAVSEFDSYLEEMKTKTIDLASVQLESWKDETERFSRNIVSIVKLRMSREDQKIQTLTLLSRNSLKGYLQKNYQKLNIVQDQVTYKLHSYFQNQKIRMAGAQKNIILQCKAFLKEEKTHLEKLENANHLLDPVHIMKRGYTLTFSNGVLIKRVSQLKPGDKIESKWNDGSALSTVEKVSSPKPSE